MASAQFVNGGFRNTSGKGPALKPGTMPVIGEFLFSRKRRFPAAPLPSVDPLRFWPTPLDTGLRVTWLGHSTMLLEIDGVTVLTDPVWGERVSPLSFAGPKRFQPVPVPIASLPKLDAVVVSHDHYDHLDRLSVVELIKLGVPFYVSLGMGAILESWGVPPDRVFELDWWQSVDVRGLRITATPSQHFSGRGVGDRNKTLWSSLVFETARHRVFFSGDTGLTDEYTQIAARFAPFDLVMLEVGAFHPAWGDIHLGPDNALEALKLLGGGPLLPVHWGTFNLAVHAWDEPAERLLEVAPKRGVQLVMPMLGAPVEPSRVDKVEPWWRSVTALEKQDAKPLEPDPDTDQADPVPDPID